MSCAAAGAAQVRPLLQAMGRGVIELGDDPAAAPSAKLIGNFLIVSQVGPQPLRCHQYAALVARHPPPFQYWSTIYPSSNPS